MNVQKEFNHLLAKSKVKLLAKYKIEMYNHGKGVKHKARLVARGFLQKFAKNYEDTYALVTKLTTIRTVLAVANERKYCI